MSAGLRRFSYPISCPTFITYPRRNIMTMNTESNYFAELAKINVNEHIERKGQFSYLSWPFAVAQLRQYEPTATWQVQRFEGLPYLATETGCYVEVAVTVRGITLSQIHPVLNGQNKPLVSPSSFDINTSIQRCLVKAIALHGLGLYIYAGEDLPDAEQNSDNSSALPLAPSASASAKPASAKPASAKSSSSKVRAFPTPKPDNGFSEPELLTPNQLRFIKFRLQETNTDEEQILNFFGYDDLACVQKQDVNRIIKMLESNRKAA